MNMNATQQSGMISDAYKAACLAELEALKPGNVHIFADGHGMTIQNFIKSATVSAEVISKPNLTVGERILYAVQATQSAVGMNTNLGIILLCAPLIHAAMNCNPAVVDQHQSFQQSLAYTLNQLTVEDARLAAQAIVLANPAGLGGSNQHDVNELPSITLLEMMSYAQDKDQIAWQYANQFADILVFGLAKYEKAMTQWHDLTNNRCQNQAWGTTALYLSFLANKLDSHVVRKHGEALAEQLMHEAGDMSALFWEAENPKLVQKHLMAWDASLKSRGINPGTSADLTVSCLLVRNFV